MNPPPPPPPPPMQSTAFGNNDKSEQARIFKTEANKTRNLIFLVAAVLFAGDMIAISIAGRVSGELILISVIFPIIYVILGFLATKYPLTAIIISLVIFVIILILNFAALGARGLTAGLVVKLIVVSVLIAGFTSANKAERAKKLMHS